MEFKVIDGDRSPSDKDFAVRCATREPLHTS